MADVLITVSGTIATDIETQIATGQRPRADYLELARTFGADLLDYPRARQLAGPLGRWIERLGGPNLLLAWVCFRQQAKYRVIFTDGEQVGLPFALLCSLTGRKSVKHLMITHILSVGKKMWLMDRFHLQNAIDTFFVYASWQKRFIEARWQVSPVRVVLTPFMVDSQFFAPQQVTAQPRRMICAVGLEFRDYPTLLEAVRDLDVEVVIAAASPWSKRSDSTQQAAIPANVTVRKFTQYELRQLYADSRFVVMPLYNVNFQAGVTAILEAMAMGKAVICSRTPGQTDVIEEGVNGLYVPPGDVQALRMRIQQLLDDPAEAEQLGQAGRVLVEAEMELSRYAQRLQRHLQEPLQMADPARDSTPAFRHSSLLS
ncbi:MAG: glycosyltransferase family 4 protein [Caldilineaceae bacterium]|nr:glycosyltransferase family 4 protein [Caldilineaceae bacterium]